MRIIKVENCGKCPYWRKYRRKYLCYETGEYLDTLKKIPKWCPLKKCEKPLLKLVAEKEYNISISRRSDKLWEIRLGEKKFIFNQYFIAKTYIEAETKAVKWLEKN